MHERAEELGGQCTVTPLPSGGTRKTADPEIFPELTDREREILQLIARGESNATIAEQLSISLKTVRNHVPNIYNKLQVADRAQAAIRAREAGLS